MAPPPTPPASASASGSKTKKNSSSSSSSDTNSTVTPVQVAFLVERYLADNGFHAALAAFRSDASHLFKPHHHKVAPKGLLSLEDILHGYITLKGSRLAIDSAMHAMHSLVSTYYASRPPPAATPVLLPPPAVAQPASPPLVPPLFVASSSSSPQGTAGYASPLVHRQAHTSTAVVAHNSSVTSTPAPATSLPTKKRKATKSARKSTSASKKSCIPPATTSHTKGKALSQLSNDNLEQNVGSAAQPSSEEHSVITNPPVQTSSVAKSLFGPQLHSSPTTPQHGHPMEDQPIAYQTEMPPSVVANAHAQAHQTQCSIVSSKTLIVSPLKGGAYYAVERSYHHVSSPLKSTIQKSSKREHVKGKLNFDTLDARPASNEQICDQMASTSSDGDKSANIEIDFTNLDIFDAGFSFSELLVDFDLDTEGVHCQNSSTSPEVQRLEPVADPVLTDSVKTMATDPSEDISSQGAQSVTSVRAITKRIKIVSPVKGHTSYEGSR